MEIFFTLSVFLLMTRPFPVNGQLFPRGPMMPRLQCTLRMAFFGFDISNFEDYGIYFKDDSVMTLAEAGAYTGADSIEEYVKYVHADFSPYRDKTEILDQQLSFLGYDRQEGNCIFLSSYHTRNINNAMNTMGADEFEVVNMVKLYFNLRERYIPIINVYYTKDYLQATFRLLSGPNTARYVCGVKDGVCSDFIDETVDNCEEKLLALPVTNDNVRFDGNSMACRVVHSVFASTNREHCPHISFNGQVDINGKLKCQVSSGVEAEDLFGEQEFEIFSAFATEKGIDPAIGHTISS